MIAESANEDIPSQVMMIKTWIKILQWIKHNIVLIICNVNILNVLIYRGGGSDGAEFQNSEWILSYYTASSWESRAWVFKIKNK